jgi:hypothetical protein
MKQHNRFVICILVLAAAFFASCAKNTSLGTLELPSTPAVSTSDRYALVLDPYISLRDKPGEQGVTVAHGRRGEIHEVTGKKIIERLNENEVWVNLGTGWVLSDSVELYSSREKAETAAVRFK